MDYLLRYINKSNKQNRTHSLKQEEQIQSKSNQKKSDNSNKLDITKSFSENHKKVSVEIEKKDKIDILKDIHDIQKVKSNIKHLQLKPKINNYYYENQEFDLQILKLPERKNKKIRTKRPYDKRLPNLDNSLNIMLCSKSNRNNNIILMNLIENNQFYNGYFDNIYIFGNNIKKSKLLRPLEKYNIYNNINDTIIINIKKQLLNNSQNGCVLLNNVSKLNFENANKIYSLCLNYHNILSSKNGGGMILFSDTKYSCFTNLLKKNVNTFIIGNLSDEEYVSISEDLSIFYESKEFLYQLIKENIVNNEDYLIIMIEGNNIYQEPCIYKNWETLLYPLNDT